MNQLLFVVNNLIYFYVLDKGFCDVFFELWLGEVFGIVGEFGFGKIILLKVIFVCLMLQQGEVLYQQCLLYVMSEVECCCLLCIEWGVVYQYLMDGLCC